MILAHPQINSIIEFSDENVNTLVIENPHFFMQFLQDVQLQIDGEEGAVVISEDNQPLNFAKDVELIDSFLSFQLNRKPLLNRILSVMEKCAVSESFYLQTADILQRISNYVEDMAFSFGCDIVCGKCSAASVIKAVGIELQDDYDNPLERIIDYMELVREFDREKLFVMVNMRSFFADHEMQLFIDTVLAHGLRILLVDGSEKTRLPAEKRLVIDNDLCEF